MEGPEGIDHHVESSSGAQHAEDFFNYLAGSLDMVKNSVGVHVVKTPVLERESSGLGMEDARQFAYPLSCQTKMCRSNVNPSSFCAVSRKLQEIGTRTAPYLQDAVALVMAKLCGFIQPRVDSVTLLLRQEEWRLIPMLDGE